MCCKQYQKQTLDAVRASKCKKKKKHCWLKCTLIFLHDNIWKSIVPETLYTSKIGLLRRLRWGDVQNHCCNSQTTGAQLYMLMGPVTLVLSLRCVCRWAWGPCDPGVYASRPRGLSGQLELHVPRDLILHVCQSPVALVITSQCMCQGAWGLWRTLAVSGPKHWPGPWFSFMDDLLN